MPTYADLWNEQQRALGQSGPSNPVRLTISKGDYIWDPHSSRYRYEEQWEEEHLMEDEELFDGAHPTAPCSNIGTVDSSEISPPTLAALQSTIRNESSSGLQHSPSLWVLDTNTLMSCLELLKALFASLLTHNVAYAAALHQQQHVSSSASPARPSSIKLVIPHVVVSELDGLKVTRRKDDSGRPVASQAREANHWLLSALQKQKRVTINQADTPLPQDLWPLFVQPTNHYNQSRRSTGGGSRWDFDDPISCDDEIVSFCVQLKQQTASHVRFCSDDINARTKAERDDIDSLGMRELANALKLNFKDVQSTQQKWISVADALIEQWEYQVGTNDAPAQHGREHYHQQFVNGDPRSLQPTLHAPTTTSEHEQLLLHNVHAHSLRTTGYDKSAVANNTLLEVDMDTEEQLLPGTSVSPIPHTSNIPARVVQRVSPSHDGRSTTDSIHSPKNARQVRMTRKERQPPSSSSNPFSTASDGADVTKEQSDQALNPQVDWDNLVQQYGSRPRAQSTQNHGRW